MDDTSMIIGHVGIVEDNSMVINNVGAVEDTSMVIAHVGSVEDEPFNFLMSTNNIQVPEVVYDHKPKVGQEFASLDEVHDFYNKYAKEVGFSVRISSSKKNKNDEITRKEYCCFKEGTSCKGIPCEKKRRRGIIRVGCNAKLAVVKTISGNFVVSLFVEEHNHSLVTPRRVHFLKSHRKVTKAQKSLTQHFLAANIPIHQQISVFESQAGGIHNIGCTEKDIYNFERDLRKEMKGHDAMMLLEHFESEQGKNSAFTFTIKTGNEDRITHCFWADAISRLAYEIYGDVVVFDTTYNTNRYSMVFAPLIGVNNHGQTIVFACAFLSDETTDSFIWLFEQFKKAMPGGAPKMIITDQDLAMTKAISEVFPDSFHRYCSWHILNKFSEKINAITYRDYYSDFQKCIWQSYTREEFDSNWIEIVEKSNLNDNAWLRSMYELRSKWVPVYINHVFSVGMSSSQRAEISHAFFKRYVSKKNSLFDFITRFNRALAHQRHEELRADHVDINEKPVFKLPLHIEKQMSEIYTHIIDKAMTRLDVSKIVEDDLESVLQKVSQMIIGTENSTQLSIAQQRQQICNEPLAVRAKGCGKRIKGGKEKNKVNVKARRCAACGKAGQSHDKRNCPMLNDR
ncbi:hypothetical protein LWI29_030171 [Acer saccharum]|uniref:Protein FAR1-RELATED SEQUENCE n=1 Tax=Acer saccharum TaxID=4024 RepID=A0AA39SNU2_ACESA|nr:hypothetical protein LWI29_030171 [Acer saccharum]